MLKIEVEKLDYSGVKCSHPNCKKDPLYHNKILDFCYFIKEDTVVAIVSMDDKVEIYCRLCIDDLYKSLKIKLDPKLWVFN